MIKWIDLENDPTFRADYLFFLQQANTYIATIFWDVFNDGNKCKQITAAVNQIEQNGKKQIDKGLRKSLFTKEGKKNLDVFKAGFIELLETFTIQRKDSFAQKLRLVHVIPLSFVDFTKLVERLKDKRHFLEHFEEKTRRNEPGPNNDRVILDLGLLLPPVLGGLFLGAVSRAISRMSRNDEDFREAVRKSFFASFEHRKQAARDANSSIRKKENMKRQKRLAAERQEQKWHKLYLRYFPHEVHPRYNHLNFKLRFLFIGEPRVEQIIQLLDKVYCPQEVHFRNEVEAVYETSMRINILIWEYLKKSGVKQKKWPKQLKAIRNHVAHNGFFWAAPDISNDGDKLLVSAVFRDLFLLANKMQDGQRKFSEFRSQIKGVLARQKYALVTPMVFIDDAGNQISVADNPARTPASKVVRYWSAGNRSKFLNSTNYRVDKRLRVIHLMRQWSRDIDDLKTTGTK